MKYTEEDFDRAAFAEPINLKQSRMLKGIDGDWIDENGHCFDQDRLIELGYIPILTVPAVVSKEWVGILIGTHSAEFEYGFRAENSNLKRLTELRDAWVDSGQSEHMTLIEYLDRNGVKANE